MALLPPNIVQYRICLEVRLGDVNFVTCSLAGCFSSSILAAIGKHDMTWRVYVRRDPPWQ